MTGRVPENMARRVAGDGGRVEPGLERRKIKNDLNRPRNGVCGHGW